MMVYLFFSESEVFIFFVYDETCSEALLFVQKDVFFMQVSANKTQDMHFFFQSLITICRPLTNERKRVVKFVRNYNSSTLESQFKNFKGVSYSSINAFSCLY